MLRAHDGVKVDINIILGYVAVLMMKESFFFHSRQNVNNALPIVVLSAECTTKDDYTGVSTYPVCPSMCGGLLSSQSMQCATRNSA